MIPSLRFGRLHGAFPSNGGAVLLALALYFWTVALLALSYLSFSIIEFSFDRTPAVVGFVAWPMVDSAGEEDHVLLMAYRISRGNSESRGLFTVCALTLVRSAMLLKMYTPVYSRV